MSESVTVLGLPAWCLREPVSWGSLELGLGLSEVWSSPVVRAQAGARSKLSKYAQGGDGRRFLQVTGTGNGPVLPGWSNACSFCLVFCGAGDRVMGSYFCPKAFPPEHSRCLHGGARLHAACVCGLRGGLVVTGLLRVDSSVILFPTQYFLVTSLSRCNSYAVQFTQLKGAIQ